MNQSTNKKLPEQSLIDICHLFYVKAGDTSPGIGTKQQFENRKLGPN